MKFASFAREFHYTTDANSCHERGFCQAAPVLIAKCIPVFVKVRRCIYSSGYPHTTTINLSSIVVSDFLPPLVITSLLEQAADWLTRHEYRPKFRFFNSNAPNAQFAPHNSRHSRRLIRAKSDSGLSIASLH